MLQPGSPSRGVSSSAGVLSRPRAWTLLPLAALLFLITPTRSAALHIVNSSTSAPLGAYPRDLAIDASGQLLIAGSTPQDEYSDMWIGTYSPGFVLISSVTIAGSGGRIDWLNGIAADSSGNIWVGGAIFHDIATELRQDGWVGKFDRSLVLQSSRVISGDAGYLDGGSIYDIAFSSVSQSIFVAGRVVPAFDAVTFLGRYDLALRTLSTATPAFVNGGGGYRLKLDNQGSIWLSGGDPFIGRGVVKLTEDFQLISSAVVQSGKPPGYRDYTYGMDMDPAGNIWAIGQAGTDPSWAWVTEHEPTGQKKREDFLGTGGGSEIAIDPGGRFWLATYTGSSIVFSLFNSDFIFVSSCTVPFGGTANKVAIAPDGSIWAVGSLYFSPEWKAWFARLAIEPEQIVGLTTTSPTATSLRWSWSAPVAFPADSYRLFQSSSGILVGTSTSTSFDYIGLTTNTAYGLRVAGVNPSGQGGLSTAATVYTLAAIPLVAAFTDTSETSLRTNWDLNGNPLGTHFTIILSTGTSPSTNGYSGNLSSTTYNPTAVFTGLSPGQIYFAEVRALNGDGVPTAYNSLGSTSTTGLAAPTGFAGTTLGISSIAWSWGNVAAESGFRVISSTDGDMSGNLVADTLTWTEVGLATNTAYTRRAVAFAATDTSTSAAVTRWTLALPPTDTVLDAVYNSSIAVSWQANTNPAGTLYQVLIWKTGSSTATWEVAATSAALTGLNQNSTYYLAVRAVNGDSVVTQLDVISSTLTLDIPVQQSVDPGSGGTIVFIPPSGTVSVNIPPQAFQQAVNVTIQTPDTVPVGGTQPTPLTATGVSIELTLDQPVQPVRPVSITVSYRDSDIVGLDETRLILARYDTLRNVWVPLLSTVDSGGNRVVGRTDHFSLFQIMQASPAGDVQSPRIFPNPLRPSQGHTGMTFMNLPAYCRVSIYTVVGELVKELQTDAAGMAAWDGTNESGRKAASGVYYVLAQGNGQSNTFKVAVQR